MAPVTVVSSTQRAPLTSGYDERYADGENSAQSGVEGSGDERGQGSDDDAPIAVHEHKRSGGGKYFSTGRLCPTSGE